MSAETLFSVANTVALASWVALLVAVWQRLQWLRDVTLARVVPLAFSAIYGLLIIFFFVKTDGGFDKLSSVKLLFTNDWIALAGWIHYLAFDLTMGCWIAQRHERAGLPRWPLLGLLPLTFLFGPLGLLTSEVACLLLKPTKANLS